MPTQKKHTHRKPTGRLIDVARVISVGQDRKTGEAILRFRDTKGSLVAVRLRPGQFRTLARGVLGLAEERGQVNIGIRNRFVQIPQVFLLRRFPA